MTKGIILAGGKGTRLLPATQVTNKHLLNILNEPMILFPIRTLQSLGIKDILIVSGGNHVGGFAEFLGNGSKFGVSLTYRVQEEAGGIAQALGLAEDFAQGEQIAVILGDNIYDNKALTSYPNQDILKKIKKDEAFLFISKQKDNARFGVPVFKSGLPIVFGRNILKIEEKPEKPKSEFAITGLYIYPSSVFSFIKKLKPSARGEMEITDVNNWFIKKKKCGYTIISGFWSDSGTVKSIKEVTDWAFQRLDK